MAKFISYGRQSIGRDDIRAVVGVLKSNFLTQGPKVLELEHKICKYTGAKYAVAVSNGTTALDLSIRALNIKPGKEGITSPNTFVASANAMLYNSISPVFADIDSKTYNLDPRAAEKLVNAKTKLIVAVHYAGQPCDMPAIKKIAKKRKLFVIEDAAHAIGSKYKDGSNVGSCKYSDLTTFSFHPVKNITTGEGGAITTNNKELYDRLIMLRTHGITKDPQKMSKTPGPWYYEMQELGFNYRMSDLQAALGVSQFKKIDRFKQKRRQIVEKYNKAFESLANITIPFEAEGIDSMFHLYTLLIDFEKIGKSRQEVMKLLGAKQVGSQVLYIPVYHQPFYRKLGYKKGLCPQAEKYYEKALSLPLYPGLSSFQINRVIKSLKRIVGGSGD